MTRDKRGFIGRDTFSLQNAPAAGAAVAVLFCVGVAMLPSARLGSALGAQGASAAHLGGAILRTAGFIALLLLALDIGCDSFCFRAPARAWLWCLPFAAVAVNNAPLIGLADGSVTVTASAGACALFAYHCLAVGLMEETAFRGIVLPLLLHAFPQTRRHAFAAVVLSSALFGAAHFVNLFTAPFPAVLAQVGYSFLVGCMCAVTFLVTRNVWAGALLHALYNFCGLIADELGSGQTWDAARIALTVAVGAAAAGYGVFLFRKKARIRQAGILRKKESGTEQEEQGEEKLP